MRGCINFTQKQKSVSFSLFLFLPCVVCISSEVWSVNVVNCKHGLVDSEKDFSSQ
jgi:hypothetical protein